MPASTATHKPGMVVHTYNLSNWLAFILGLSYIVSLRLSLDKGNLVSRKGKEGGGGRRENGEVSRERNGKGRRGGKNGEVRKEKGRGKKEEMKEKTNEKEMNSNDI